MKYKDWLDEWLTYYVKPTVKERSYEKYSQQVQNYILPFLGNYGVDELSARILQKFAVSLTEKGLAVNTANSVISVLKSSLKRAVMLGVAEIEYTGGITRLKAREKNVECFSLSEQRKMEAYILGGKDSKLFGVVFCLYTGLRIGELLALKWEDIDFRKGICSVSKTCMDSWEKGKYVKVLLSPKTERSNRIIPIPKQLLQKIKELYKSRSCEYVVGGRGEYGSQVRSYQKTFDKLLIALKLPHRGFHSLRHTFATRALECGMDVKTLSEILGHSNPTITLKRYVHSMLEHKTEMMNRVGKLLTQQKMYTD